MSVANVIKTARDEFLTVGNVSDGQLLQRAGQSVAGPSKSIDFNGQQALNFVIENRTSDPASPATGAVWLRTDL